MGTNGSIKISMRMIAFLYSKLKKLKIHLVRNEKLNSNDSSQTPMKTFTRAIFTILDHFYAFQIKCEALSLEISLLRCHSINLIELGNFSKAQEAPLNYLRLFYGSLSKLTNVSSALKEKILRHFCPNQG